jgi:hypothetical protein
MQVFARTLMNPKFIRRCMQVKFKIPSRLLQTEIDQIVLVMNRSLNSIYLQQWLLILSNPAIYY